MSNNLNYIKNRLSLRKPQADSLEILEKILGKIELTKEYNNDDALEKVHALCPTCTDFERNFPSICFSLATGVGKTRLMAAFMIYLYKEKGIKNFMVIAPNLTIYNKLIRDFGDFSYEKFAFKGISEFSQNNLRVITGDNYKEEMAGQIGINDITINVFNISKINAETKGGKLPQIKRLSEYIGQSYFNYLSKLEDLVILMDESHHYRADRGMQVLNELNPVIGLELTATPQTEQGSHTVKFKNVVYEYSLACAINDGFVKVPHVATKKNYNPDNYTSDIDRDIIKLQDGIRLHEDTKTELDIYARNNKVKRVKPFVLVVAKDTTHAEELLSIIKDDTFFNGYYKDKVIIVHSNQSGTEKDENIEQLVSLEDTNNKIEIVIHVNMLKEGWDVNNLYTIIPLRTSASSTLTEQTIGRGLRLPYGKVTGNDKVDRLSIVSHDKYNEIIRLANDPNSLIRKVFYIDEEENIEKRKEIITSKSGLESQIQEKQESITKKENWQSDEKLIKEHADLQAQKILISVIDNKDNTEIKNFNDLYKPRIKEKVIENVKKVLEEKAGNQVMIQGYNDSVIEAVEKNFNTFIAEIKNNIIEIPRISLMQSENVKHGFNDFDLDTSNLNLRPEDGKLIITNLITNENEEVESKNEYFSGNTLEDNIVSGLIDKPEIEYDNCCDLLYKLANQAIEHLKSLEENKGQGKIENVVSNNKKLIVNYIYQQLKEHFYCEDAEYIKPNVFPFTKIEEHNYSRITEDDILDYNVTVPASEIRSRVFTGFRKACHVKYKFDSTPEKDFSFCLEKDEKVLKWLRPAPLQFRMYWNREGNLYEPDFIVETNDTIYMVEVKRRDLVDTDEVKNKMKVGKEFCKYATEYNKENGNKEWKYMLIPDDNVKLNYSFSEYEKYFVK